nr:MAG TPA: hypothetical protein [Caudoviricetes sp.]
MGLFNIVISFHSISSFHFYEIQHCTHSLCSFLQCLISSRFSNVMSLVSFKSIGENS